jgi:hypothetical protein
MPTATAAPNPTNVVSRVCSAFGHIPDQFSIRAARDSVGFGRMKVGIRNSQHAASQRTNSASVETNGVSCLRSWAGVTGPLFRRRCPGLDHPLARGRQISVGINIGSRRGGNLEDRRFLTLSVINMSRMDMTIRSFSISSFNKLS